MTYLSKYKIIFSLVIYLFCSATSIFACDCRGISTEEAFKQSTLVFSGKVVGLEYRKDIPNRFMDEQAKATGVKIDYESLIVRIQVNQWWKGDAPPEIFLLTDDTKNADGSLLRSSCDYDFLKDESYLIFAEGKENEYRRANNCSGTQKLTEAEKTIKILGEGKKPIEIKDKSDLPR